MIWIIQFLEEMSATKANVTMATRGGKLILVFDLPDNILSSLQLKENLVTGVAGVAQPVNSAIEVRPMNPEIKTPEAEMPNINPINNIIPVSTPSTIPIGPDPAKTEILPKKDPLSETYISQPVAQILNAVVQHGPNRIPPIMSNFIRADVGVLRVRKEVDSDRKRSRSRDHKRSRSRSRDRNRRLTLEKPNSKTYFYTSEYGKCGTLDSNYMRLCPRGRDCKTKRCYYGHGGDCPYGTDCLRSEICCPLSHIRRELCTRTPCDMQLLCTFKHTRKEREQWIANAL